MWLANNVKYLVLDDILELNTSLTIPLIDISIYILDVSAMSGYMIALAYLILDSTYVYVRILCVVSSIIFHIGLILLIFFLS